MVVKRGAMTDLDERVDTIADATQGILGWIKSADELKNTLAEMTIHHDERIARLDEMISHHDERMEELQRYTRQTQRLWVGMAKHFGWDWAEDDEN